MKSFIALYRGPSVAAAELVAVSADPALVRYLTAHLLATERDAEDPVVGELDRGRRRALRLVQQETQAPPPRRSGRKK